MDVQEIGRQLRARRASSGRTVASVAMDAGLSVPYVANLENGRGNPTISALRRLAAALGIELTVSLEPAGGRASTGPRNLADMPQALVRLGRTGRFRSMAETASAQRGVDPGEFATQVLNGLALVQAGLGRDLSEADCWRLIDALTLVVMCPGA